VPVELVEGLSLPGPDPGRLAKKALNTVFREMAGKLDASPKVVELSPTNCESVDGAGLGLKIWAFSDEKASWGKVSTA
jgi:hypothetical protein